jgi:hypothetical protein
MQEEGTAGGQRVRTEDFETQALTLSRLAVGLVTIVLVRSLFTPH